jgi:hypothetical protein
MEDYLKKALEEIDAGIFSGDALCFQDTRTELKQYAERWLREIQAYETVHAEDALLEKA